MTINKIIRKKDLDLSEKPFPAFYSPQLATLIDAPPLGDQWLHEVKYDGYRMMAFKQNGKLQLLSRNNKDWTDNFHIIVEELKQLPVKNVILDGEIVVLDKDSRSDFQLLQNAIHDKKGMSFIYYIFDVLYYEKWDLRRQPLMERKQILEEIVSNKASRLRFSDHVVGQGDEVFKQACQLNLEGIISKKVDSVYVSRRSSSWLKSKCTQRQEFVVGGFSEAQGSRLYFGALYLGLYDENQKLIFCGKVGTGFNENTLKMIYSQLKKLRSPVNPFDTFDAAKNEVTWVKPEMVVEVAFTEWTKSGKLRHPSFKGVRADKPVKDISKEQ